MLASRVVGKSTSVLGKSGRNTSLYAYITKMEPENNHLKKESRLPNSSVTIGDALQDCQPGG